MEKKNYVLKDREQVEKEKNNSKIISMASTVKIIPHEASEDIKELDTKKTQPSKTRADLLEMIAWYLVPVIYIIFMVVYIIIYIKI